MTLLKKSRRLLLGGLLLLTGTFLSSQPLAAAEALAPLPSAGLPALENYIDSGYSRSYGVLPASYDSRTAGYITPVKNQNPWGTCWAFGALSAGEASLIKKGLADTSVDLSELHLSYFFFNSNTDPMGNTKGDTVDYPVFEENYLESGGNNLFTMFALSKWLGPVPESAAPYSLASENAPTLNASLAYTETAHLQNARFVSSGDVDSVKQLILDYGAVSTAIYFNQRYFSENNAYYCPYLASSNNHIISLVGWDDNYAVSNFSGAIPSSPGAWIAKNSYGTDFGDDGYFYISYEDMTLCNYSDSLSYAFDLESADNYDHNYQYDGSFSVSIFNSSNGSSFANIYTVSGNPGGREKLEAVSFSLYSPNISYKIQIYKNPDPGEPTSGTPMLKTPQTGTTSYSGYYTIPLKTQPVFEQGDTFSIVLTFEALNSSSFLLFVDHTSITAGIQFTSKVSKYQSFCKIGSTWNDLYEMEIVARIKAFTSNTTEAATSTNGKVTGSKYLATPRITRAYSSAYNSVTLKWPAVENAKYYKIYRSTSPNGTFVRIKTTKECQFTDTKRTCGKTYYYRIRVCRGTKYSAYSNMVNVTPVPARTTFKKLSALHDGLQVRLTWTKVDGASGYLIYRSTSKNGSYQKVKAIKSQKSLSTILELPKYNKRYYYKIKAYRTVNGKRVIGKSSGVKSIKIER